jgi:HTH-type transcriptional regulator/antitoxin HigA
MIKAIKNAREHTEALERIYSLMQKKLVPGSSDANELEVLSILVEKFEDEHYSIGPPDPIEAIKFAMEHQNLRKRDLAKIIGHKSRVSEILKGKRKLTLPMIRNLHRKLKIPLESLIGEY